MKDRRDFLRLFGAGAIIAPIIGTTADETKAARLIESPRVQPVELYKSIPQDVDLSGAERMTITIEGENGVLFRASNPVSRTSGVIMGAYSHQISVTFNVFASPMVETAKVSMWT